MSGLAKTLARLAAILGSPDGDAVALDGGIINRNFKVVFDGKPYVIRIRHPLPRPLVLADPRSVALAMSRCG